MGFLVKSFPFGQPGPFVVTGDIQITEPYAKLVQNGTEINGQWVEHVEIQGSIWIATNATYSGSWNQVDSTKISTAFVLPVGGGITTFSSPAGTSPIVWTALFNVNASGGLTSGGGLTAGAALANIGPAGITATYLAAGVALANLGSRAINSATLARADQLTQIGWFSVRDYGAVGDGTTDDTTAIKATITAAGVGGLVWFPQGSYRVSSPITPLSYQTWQGQSPQSTIITTLFTDYANFSSNYIITNGTSTDVDISRVKIDGQRRNASAGQAASFAGGISLGDRWNFHDSFLYDINYFAAWIGVAKYPRIERVQFFGGGSLTGQQDGIGGGSGKGLVVIGCRWDQTYNSTTSCMNVLGMTEAYVAANLFQSNSQKFAIFQEWTDSVIENNVLETGALISLETSLGTSVTNPARNVVRGNRLTGIAGGVGAGFIRITYYTATGATVQGGGNLISGNIIDTPQTYGIGVINSLAANSYGSDHIDDNHVFNANQGNGGFGSVGTGYGTVSPSGIVFLRPTPGSSIRRNTCIDTRATPQMFYGIEVGVEGATTSVVGQMYVEGNTLSGFKATGANYVLASGGSTDTPPILRGNFGINPKGSLGAFPLPGTGVSYTNITGFDATLHVTGGTVSAISIAGTSTGVVSGTFRLMAGQAIIVTYTVAPSITWFGD